MEGDPARRWQTLADLVSAPAETVQRERSATATSGWGKHLLEQQDPHGTWAGGLYSPKWTSTTYTLALLRRLGLPPDNKVARRGVHALLDGGDWVDGGIVFWKASTPTLDLAVVGIVVAIASYFWPEDDRVRELVRVLRRHQRDDGSWHDDVHDVRHREVHVAMSVLEGLAEYQRREVALAATVASTIEAGNEFLLCHGLFLTDDAARAVDPAWTRFSFPPRWHYDVLRALDHLRSTGAAYDPRMDPALDLVERRRGPDGTWTLQNRHPGRTWFELERVGEPSRWNTLRALRVLGTYRPG